MIQELLIMRQTDKWNSNWSRNYYNDELLCPGFKDPFSPKVFPRRGSYDRFHFCPLEEGIDVKWMKIGQVIWPEYSLLGETSRNTYKTAKIINITRFEVNNLLTPERGEEVPWLHREMSKEIHCFKTGLWPNVSIKRMFGIDPCSVQFNERDHLLRQINKQISSIIVVDLVEEFLDMAFKPARYRTMRHDAYEVHLKELSV